MFHFPCEIMGQESGEQCKAAGNKHTESFGSTVFCTRGTLSRKSGWYHILIPTTLGLVVPKATPGYAGGKEIAYSEE